MSAIKKYRSARIDVVANGFIIEIGCQRIVAETPEKLKKMISDYLDDPIGAEKKLLSDSIQYGDCIPERPQGSLIRAIRQAKQLLSNA